MKVMVELDNFKKKSKAGKTWFFLVMREQIIIFVSDKLKLQNFVI
jgi:hypothetical protein